jgi:hypothetical protein
MARATRRFWKEAIVIRGRSTVFSAFLAGLALALTAACGGSKAVTGGGDPVASGAAILNGVVTGAGEGTRVVAVGTPASATVDEDGAFVLTSLPAGTANLRFEGGGANATVAVPGLQDGLVATVQVRVTGATAELAGPVNCASTADTFFSGLIERIAGTQLVVAGRTVDASQLQKVWRGERRIQLSELQVGEKVKVWGKLRADAVVVAEEIAALTTGSGETGETWTSFTGKVESVTSSSLGARDVHADPNAGYYPTVVVAGRTVRTSDQTKLTWSDGVALDPRSIKAGQTAFVEGWKKTDGSVRATTFRIEEKSPAGSKLSFRGQVESVATLDTGGQPIVLSAVHSSCYLRMTIAGYRVETDGSTVLRWSDGSDLDPYAVRVGDRATVEGWTQSNGVVLASKLVVDKR